MESRKRKREADAPRIKYHVEQRGKSFERILKENSLEELCAVVRKKIGLDSKTKLELVQTRDGVVYDLEDDEDFEAFKSAAYAYSSLDVRVSFATEAVPGQNASNARPGGSSLPGTSTSSSNTQGDSQKKKTAHKSTGNAGQGQSTQKSLVNGARFVAVTNADGVQSLESDRANSVLSSANEEMAAPPKKRRKKAHPDSEAVAAAGETKKKRAKVKESDARAFNTVVPIGDADKRPVEKKRKRGQESDVGTSGTPGDGTQVTTAEPSDTAKAKSKSKSKKKLAATTDTSTHGLESIIAQTLQTNAGKEQPTDGGNGTSASTKVSSTLVPVSTKPASHSAPKPVDAESPPPHAPHADPGTSSPNSIRRAYASVFSKLPRTASEIMANYSAASPSASSTSSEARSEPVAKAAAPSKKTKTKVDAKEKGEGAGIVTKIKTKTKAKEKEKGKGADVATSDGVKDMPESGLARNDQSDSRTPVDVEDEVHPAPLPRTRPSRVPRGIYAPPRKSGKQSTSPSQLLSPCPICLAAPFHLRFVCPVIKSGPDAIVERIAQLKATGGRDDLVSDLEAWVGRERKKAEGKGAATRTEREATPKKVSPLPIAVGRAKPLDSPLPPWAAIQARPSSDVIVESTHEGSEQASSSSSDQDEAQIRLSSSLRSASASASSSSGSSSASLEGVDLDALIRGPSLPAMQWSKLANGSEEGDAEEHDDAEDDDTEGDNGLLEEEAEEPPVPKRLKALDLMRAKSPEAADSDEDEESGSGGEQQRAPSLRSSTHAPQSAATEPSGRNTTDENGAEQDGGVAIDDDDNTQGVARAQLNLSPPGARPTGSTSVEGISTEMVEDGSGEGVASQASLLSPPRRQRNDLHSQSNTPTRGAPSQPNTPTRKAHVRSPSACSSNNEGPPFSMPRLHATSVRSPSACSSHNEGPPFSMPRLHATSVRSPPASSSHNSAAPAPMRRLHAASKSSFPSLSQLSLDKFKPSFLLTSVFSQKPNRDKDAEARPADGDDSGEEDEIESSHSERESHIPRDKRAGVSVGKRTKARGLLH